MKIIKVLSVLDETIPTKFRQQTYDHEHGCVWLSTCLLGNSVDNEIADNMIELYFKNQEQFEWMDLFNRKGRSGKTTTTLRKRSLYK